MIRRTSWKIVASVAVAGMVGATAAIQAQNATTGTLGGVVRDAQQGVLPGAERRRGPRPDRNPLRSLHAR